jgi:hypothetical protein
MQLLVQITFGDYPFRTSIVFKVLTIFDVKIHIGKEFEIEFGA